MAAISLTGRDGGVTGMVGDNLVDLHLERNGLSRVSGDSFGARVDGHWRIESNCGNDDPVELFLGEYDGLPVFLRSEVHLAPLSSLRHADITGDIGSQQLRARAAPVDAAGPLVVGIDGHFDGQALTLFATIAGDLSGGQLAGVIGAHHLKIEATRTNITEMYDGPPASLPLTITGEYDGPPALFPLLVCALVYFL